MIKPAGSNKRPFHHHRRSKTLTISPPLPFPPSYYLPRTPEKPFHYDQYHPNFSPLSISHPHLEFGDMTQEYTLYSNMDGYFQPPSIFQPDDPIDQPHPPQHTQHEQPGQQQQQHQQQQQPEQPEQSYFDPHTNLRPTYIPFSPSDYDLTSFTAPRSPPSPPGSPPSLRASSPSPPPLSPRKFSYSSRRSTSESIQLPSPNNVQEHKRGTPSLGSGASYGVMSRPSYSSMNLSRSSFDTDGGRMSDFLADLSGLISEKLDDVINHMDRQLFSGRDKDLALDVDSRSTSSQGFDTASGGSSISARSLVRGTTASQKTNYFAKVYHYANSRLPPSLPLLQLYISTWPLLCLSAQFSQRAYNRPTSAEKETYIDGDIQGGTKSMVIKSVPLDHMNLIVFAIRGTSFTSFTDWATNMNTEPVAPHGFLDDAGNLCHAGFLSVARRMVRPIALRLEQLLAEKPSRESCSLVMTGHSAGGAVASLLYAHILSQTLRSELIYLRNRFKRIHCFTFGSPPISILPLDKPAQPKYNKWLFFTFINEGDLVTRAEKPYIRSLIDLYKTPVREFRTTSSLPLKLSLLSGKDRRKEDKTKPPRIVWQTPAPNLMLAGSLILLRGNRDNPKDKNYAEACLTRNEDLAGIVFGDVTMHMMTLYERRIELLATEAVTKKFPSPN